MATYFETYEIIGDALDDLRDWDNFEADLAEEYPWDDPWRD